MTLEDACFQAIIESPEDDLPRLADADWLHDRGDPRGDFIHAQCRLARMGEEDPRRREFEALGVVLLATGRVGPRSFTLGSRVPLDRPRPAPPRRPAHPHRLAALCMAACVSSAPRSAASSLAPPASQLAMLNGRIEAGAVRGVGLKPEAVKAMKAGGRVPPSSWAAFVLSGDWR